VWHPKSVGVLVILVMVLGALAAGILSAPSVRLPAGTASADPAVPNPGHSYTEIEVPAGTWTGLDADKVDGLDGSQLDVPSRPGFSLTTLDSGGDVGIYTSVAVGADGLGLISYYDNTNKNLKVAHCSNAACSAATVTTLAGGGSLTMYTSVTVGGDGLGLISYFDDINDNLMVAHCSNVACTSAATTTLDSTGSVGMSISVAVGADGWGLISYFDNTNGDLKVVHCGNAACDSGNVITTLDSTGIVGINTSVTVGADGLGLISYYDNSNSDLKVVHCGNVACDSGNTITTLDSGGSVGRGSSVAVGADGRGLVSYYDETNGDLKVVHCGNSFCDSGNTITTLDSTGDVGRMTSVTVGEDGLGLISYYTNTNNDLKVAHCSDATCSSATTTIVDGGVSGGSYNSVTVGGDGLGLISYYDSTNTDLKVAHCSNRFCVPYLRPR